MGKNFNFGEGSFIFFSFMINEFCAMLPQIHKRYPPIFFFFLEGLQLGLLHVDLLSTSN